VGGILGKTEWSTVGHWELSQVAKEAVHTQWKRIPRIRRTRGTTKTTKLSK
jgi:hypothetical protein